MHLHVRQMLRRRGAAALVVVASALVASGPAMAAGTPSAPVDLTFGQAHTFGSSRGTTAEFEWMRLPVAMKLGDQVQLAISAEKRGRFCLIAATDDFGLTAAQKACNRPGLVGTAPHVDVQGQVRETLKWSADTSGVYLIANAESNAQGGRPLYTVTVESISSTLIPPPAVSTTPAPAPTPSPAATAAPAPTTAPAPAPINPVIREGDIGASFTKSFIRLHYSVDQAGTEYHEVRYKGRVVAEYGGETEAGDFALKLRFDRSARARIRRALRSSAPTRMTWTVSLSTPDGGFSEETFRLKFS